MRLPASGKYRVAQRSPQTVYSTANLALALIQYGHPPRLECAVRPRPLQKFADARPGREFRSGSCRPRATAARAAGSPAPALRDSD